MNNTFNLKRFVLLFKKHSLEHAKIYLLSTVVLIGLLFWVLGFISYTNRGHLDIQSQVVMFIFFILGAGSIFTSLSFIELGDKKKAIPFLTLPASHFEKYLVSWLYAYVIFQLVFVGGFYLVDSIIIHLGAPVVDDRDKIIDIFDSQQSGPITFLGYTLLNGVALWGAVFFEKLHFIKTSVVFFIFLVIIFLVNGFLLSAFIGNNRGAGNVPFEGAGFNDGIHFFRIYPGRNIIQYGKYIIELTALLLWTTAFFRLKEKEV